MASVGSTHAHLPQTLFKRTLICKKWSGDSIATSRPDRRRMPAGRSSDRPLVLEFEFEITIAQENQRKLDAIYLRGLANTDRTICDDRVIARGGWSNGMGRARSMERQGLAGEEIVDRAVKTEESIPQKGF